mmetsp:Transcript_54642/g.155511  ORF Transcript_54642/g.155511 Transcript_54642/m.155511 type:complete len:234 (+) Transcript_54642:413-1114(+)
MSWTASSRSRRRARMRVFAASILPLASSPMLASSSWRPSSSRFSSSAMPRWRPTSASRPRRAARSSQDSASSRDSSNCWAPRSSRSRKEGRRTLSWRLRSLSRRVSSSCACSRACSSKPSTRCWPWACWSRSCWEPCRCWAVHSITCCFCDRSSGPQWAIRSFLAASAVQSGRPDGPRSSALQREMQALGARGWRGPLRSACSNASPSLPGVTSPTEATESLRPGSSSSSQLW